MALQLTADLNKITHSCTDLSYITVGLVDAHGVSVLEASELITLTVEVDPGEIAAVVNQRKAVATLTGT